MKLEVQICTMGPEGLQRVGEMTLPRLENVSYTICLQNPNNYECAVPQFLASRDDIRILEHSTRGLSRNRNFGLDRATGDIILIADDDLKYTADGLRKIIGCFESHPEVDYATFGHRGGDNKWFPEREFDFCDGEPKGYYLTSFELALRRSSIGEDTRFSVYFGLGAWFAAGEENLFELYMRRKGLRGRYFPLEIVEHPSVSSGSRKPTEGLLRAQGAFFRIKYGKGEGMLRLLRDVPRRHTNWIRAAYHMITGYSTVEGWLEG